jgi:methylase of polypeptide subunit release factors
MQLAETETDVLVRDHFITHDPKAVVHLQKSGRPEVDLLLKNATKVAGGTGVGSPDVFIWSLDHPDLLVIVESKRDTAKHESANRDNPVDFAVDGVLHYARFLAPKFDIIAVAVSGTKSNALRVSTFRWLKGEKEGRDLTDRTGKPITRLLESVEAYAKTLAFDQGAHNRTVAELNTVGRELNEYFRNIGLDDKKKPLLMSATLLALRDEPFRAGYPKTVNTALPRFFIDAVKRQLDGLNMPGIKRETLLSAFSFIETDGIIRGVEEAHSPLRYVIGRVQDDVLPHTVDNDEIDAVGAFYQEFLRYRGADQKNKGIVLTPRHITDLFAEIADVRPHHTVLDPCSGSGGFLIAAMSKMDAEARDQAEIERIHARQLIGIELETEMFALAAVNMILRGDGKSNLYSGSCFDTSIVAEVSTANAHHSRPQIGLINPPYATDKKTKASDEKGKVVIDSGKSELEFIELMLDCLEPGGTGVAIVPVSCAIGMDTKAKEDRRRILSKHTLDAVMSMPPEVFYPTGVHTCIMVFRAGEPHERARRDTWFGYWKHDGFVKVKNLGRIDRKGVWPSIRERWLDLYRTRASVAGESVVRKVGPNDEWVADAYMETDFARLSQSDFEAVLRKFAVFRLVSESGDENDESEDA